MTTYNIKSTVITNRDATPKVLTDGIVEAGTYSETEGYIQTHGGADGNGSVYRMVQVPSNARVCTVKIQADSLGTNCTADVGVWWPTFIPVGAGLSASVSSTVINTTLFASAFAVSSITAITEITNNAGNNSIANQELPLWSAAGLGSDPGIPLDIVIHLSGSVQIQGYIGLKVGYQF